MPEANSDINSDCDRGWCRQILNIRLNIRFFSKHKLPFTRFTPFPRPPSRLEIMTSTYWNINGFITPRIIFHPSGSDKAMRPQKKMRNFLNAFEQSKVEVKFHSLTLELRQILEHSQPLSLSHFRIKTFPKKLKLFNFSFDRSSCKKQLSK